MFSEVLGDIYALRAGFMDNVNDEFGANVNKNEIGEMINIAQQLCECEEEIRLKLNEINMRLIQIQNMVPLC